MVTAIAESNLSRVTNADWLPCRCKVEKEIDWLSDYYSKHAVRTFIPSEAFHDTIGDASRRQRFFLKRASAARAGYAFQTANLAGGIYFL